MRPGIRTLALVGLFAFAHPAGADDTPAAKPVVGKAATPRACVEGMIACARNHDIDGLCAFMAEPARSTMPKTLKAQRAGQLADEHLVKALEAKFGADAASDLGMRPHRPGLFEGEIEIGDVTEQGDTATVKLKIAGAEGRPAREQTVELTRVDGVWYAKPPAFGRGGGGGRNRGPGGGEDARGGGGADRPQPTAEERAKMQEARTAALAQATTDTEALAVDVEAGKVASKDAAKARYDEIRKHMQEAMRPAGAPSGPRDRPQGDRPKGGPETPKHGDF